MSRAGWVLTLLVQACTVDPLGVVGRPCPCGPGAVCDPGSNRCVVEKTDRGVDTLHFPDGDGPPGDQLLDLSGLDLPPTDRWAGEGPATCQGSTCPLGCNTSLNRCNFLAPSGFAVANFHSTLTATLTLDGTNGDVVFDTDTGAVSQGNTTLRSAGGHGSVKNGIYWNTVSQGSGLPDLAVFGVADLELAQGVSAQVTGQRAFALYAATSLKVGGTLSAPALGQKPGAGGFAGGPKNGASGTSCFGGQGSGGGQAGVSTTQLEAGGGGGGRKAQGGRGGNGVLAPNLAPGGAGGGANGGATLLPLYGGCGGGAGGGPDTAAPNGDGGYGGGGGGAMQLVSGGTLVVTGAVSAPGAGGDGGHSGGGGGGGGSGGAILLEGVAVTVSGVLAANGGGGGSGSGGLTMADAPDGQDGTAGAQSALGGLAPPQYGAAGGKGGALGSDSGANGLDLANGGGGGGGAGRIRINSPTLVNSGVVSPTPSTSTSVAVW